MRKVLFFKHAWRNVRSNKVDVIPKIYSNIEEQQTLLITDFVQQMVLTKHNF